MAYDALTSGDVDADSPADTTLWTKVKDNFDDLDAARVTNGDTHDHAGGDGNTIPQGGLKTAVTSPELSTSSASWVSQVLAGGQYSFYPQWKQSAFGYGSLRLMENVIGLTSYSTRVSLISDGTNTVYCQSRYISASPPYKIGGRTWGHFLFLTRKIGTGEIISMWHAEDPPWGHNGLLHLPKDHPNRIAEVPHPFCDYFGKDPAVDGLEIVLVDLSGINVVKWAEDNLKVGKGLLEDVGSVLTGKGAAKVWSDYTVPTIPKFTDKVKVITP